MPTSANDEDKLAPSPVIRSWPLAELRPHPLYAKHNRVTNLRKTTALLKLGENAFADPISVTADGIIIDGYARYDLARQQNRSTLTCVVHELNEEDALRALIRAHLKSIGLTNYLRVVLALELEPQLQEIAVRNRQKAGRDKDSSKLAKAERIDVRFEVSKVAAVSTGNVSKVKQLRCTAIEAVLRAVAGGEITIHRAWVWSKLSAPQQTEALTKHRHRKGINDAVRRLIREHVRPRQAFVSDLTVLLTRLTQLKPDHSSIYVGIISLPGKALLISDELAEALVEQGELDCQ